MSDSGTGSAPASVPRLARPGPGTLLQRYRLIEEVGQGGMAIVWRAEDTGLGREVAVKVLHPHLANQDESRARLEREAHAVAKLRHDNILEIYDYSGAASTESFLVTEFIHGMTLRQHLNAHPLTMPEVGAMIASEIALALEHAHAHGVIHRDIKPENVMIRRDDGRCKLMDFGIAQIIDKERMTMTGQLMGSPAYMAPEHINGKVIDARTDIFALGILTYQLVSGQLPFRGKNPHEVLRKIADCKFVPAATVNPRIGSALEATIGRALKRDPGERFDDVTRFRQELIDDLAEAGITDVRRELAEFFAAPEVYEKQRVPRLVAALTERGRAHVAAGRRARALQLWSRALAYAPGSADLQAAIAGLERRRNAGRVLIAISAAAAVAACGWAAAPWLEAQLAPRPIVLPAPKPVVPIAAPRPAGPESPSTPQPIVKVSGPSPGERPATPAPRTPPRPTPAPTPAPAPVVSSAPRDIELSPTPKAVTVTLDGKPLGDFGPQLMKLSLAPGKHTLLLESPVCFPETREIKDSESGKISVRLRWKPASLTVTTKPDGADVLVDSTTPLRVGKPLPVTIPERAANGRRKVRLQVSMPGYETKELEVEVTANENKEVPVTLAPKG